MENLFRNSAWLYDVDNRDNLTSDIPFYLEYAKKQQGKILELGCGTGRVAIVLVDNGYHLTGLDLSKEMLEIFKQKLSKNTLLSERVELVHGNMADFNLDKKFDMIIAPFRAFQALTKDSDIDNSLSCICNHLTDKGIFIVNVFNPISERMTEQTWCHEERVQWERLDENTGNYVVKKDGADKIDTKNQIIYPHFTYEVTYPNGAKEKIRDNLELKYYFYDQLKAVVEKAGMEVTEEYSWYDKSPIGGRELIFVCRKKR